MNLPPFYIGQEVICLTDFLDYKKHGFNTPDKNKTYKVRALSNEYNSKEELVWCISLVEVVNKPRLLIKKGCEKQIAEVVWVATNFIELQTLTCGKLKLTKVLEKVSEFVFAN